MAPSTTARVAGSAFLLYIPAGIATMMISGQATGGSDLAAKLTSIAQHDPSMRFTIPLGFVGILCAVVLGVTLWSLTRHVDPELAMLGLCCRVGEGILGAIPTLVTLCLVELSRAPSEAPPAAALLFRVQGWNTLIAATFFALGSTAFSLLLVRGRVVPSYLAWLGVVASGLLALILPLQLAGFLSEPITSLVWIPMLLFEVPLALWLLVKGWPEAVIRSAAKAAS